MSVVDHKRARFVEYQPSKGQQKDPEYSQNYEKIDSIFREDKSILEIADTQPITSLDALFDKKESRTLTTIDISRNSVVKLVVDEAQAQRFPKLTKIIAEENIISQVNLSVRTLKELNLSDNVLYEIPDLSGMPKLETLLLRHNSIERIHPGAFAPVVKSLNFLDISSNAIEFKTNDDMVQMLGEIKKLQRLEILVALGNPFVRQIPEYKRELFSGMTHIKKIDGISGSEVKIDKDFDLKSVMINFTERSTQSRRSNKKKMHRLNDMLEECLTNPSLCADLISEVARESLEISRDVKKWDEIFFSTPKNDDTREVLELFLERCLILIENQQLIQPHLVDCIANFSIINRADFGQKCFEILLQLSDLGTEKNLRDYLKESIKENIMIWIKFKDSQKLKGEKKIGIITDLLKGLNTLVVSNEMAALFDEPEYLANAASWISEFKQKIRECLKSNPNDPKKSSLIDFRKANSLEFENEDFYDQLIDLIRRITAYPQCARGLIKTKGFSVDCTEIFDTLDRIARRSSIVEKDDRDVLKKWHNREIIMLEIIDNISKLGEESAKEFINPSDTKNTFYLTLYRILKKLCELFANVGYNFSNNDSKFDPKLLYTMYYRFATYIRIFGTLLRYFKLAEIEAALSYKEPGDEILSYFTIRRVDPIVVTASCDFLHSLLTNKEAMRNRNVISACIEKVQTLEKVVMFLGDERYPEACEQLNKYGEGTQTERGDPVPISKLNSSIMHKLFISIIKLIAIICERAAAEDEEDMDEEQEEIKRLYEEYSETLNDLERETLLFNCLDCPNDEVKLAVARCLDKIKINEIDSDELSHLVKIIGAQKNLGVGKTEEILSLIFLILSKVIRKTTTNSREFIARYSKGAVENCIDIFVRDMARNLSNEPEEQEEKVVLAVSCLHFLKIASSDSTMRSYMSGEKALQCLKLSLFCEEKFMSGYDIPMDIESTWIGRKVDNLFQCMSGDETVQPYSLFAFRIINRLADILTAKKDPEPVQLLKAEDSINALKEDIANNLRRRIREEIVIWGPPIKLFKEDNSKLRKQQLDKYHFEEQHETFSVHNGVERLLVFLLGGEDSIQERNIMKDVDKKFFTSNLELEARNKIKNFERTYKEKSAKLMNTQTKPTKKTKKFFAFLKKDGGNFSTALVDKMKTEEITLHLSSFQLSRLVVEPQKAEKMKSEKMERMFNDDSTEEYKLQQSRKPT